MHKWPVEVVEWMRENTPGRTTKQLTALINQQGFDKKYNMAFNEIDIKAAKARYGLKSGTPFGTPKGYSSKYPDGMEKYIRSIAEGKETGEIAAAVSKHFGIEFSISQCRAYKKNHNITSGLDCRFEKGNVPANKGKKMSPEQYERCKATMFQKGNVSANHMKIGECTHTTGGYLVQKVQEEGTQWERFRPVHQIVWEQHNGPVPEGKKIIFLDGDKDNCSIENLELIDSRENLELNRSGLRFSDAEFTKAGVTLVKIKVMARQKARNVKGKHDSRRTSPGGNRKVL